MSDATTIHVLVQAIAVLMPYEKELQVRLDGARKNLRSNELLRHANSFSVTAAREHLAFIEEQATKAADALMQMKALVASASITPEEAIAHYRKVAPEFGFCEAHDYGGRMPCPACAPRSNAAPPAPTSDPLLGHGNELFHRGRRS